MRHRHVERAGGGYRILDWEAVECALDLVHQRTGEDPGPSPPTRNTRPRSRPEWPSPWSSPRRAGMPSPCRSHRARGPRRAARRMRPVARHRAGSFLRRPEPGQWYLLVKDMGTRNSYGGPSMPVAPDKSPGRSGLPCVPPRSTRPGSTTMRILPRLRSPVLPPALAPVRHRIRLLPLRPRQGPGPHWSPLRSHEYSSNFWCRSGDLRLCR